MTIAPEQLTIAANDEFLIKGFTKLAALGSSSVGAELVNELMRAERRVSGGPSTDMMILERLSELLPQAEDEEIESLYINTLAMALSEFAASPPD